MIGRPGTGWLRERGDGRRRWTAERTKKKEMVVMFMYRTWVLYAERRDLSSGLRKLITAVSALGLVRFF